MYDFVRFNQVYNRGQPLRWPMEQLQVSPFHRQDVGENDDQVQDNQSRQPFVPFSEACYFLPADFREQDKIHYEHPCDAFQKTLHADSLLIGFAEHFGKLERYMIKFFPNDPKAVATAKREVLLSYLLVESGEGDHAPKITMQYLDGLPYLIRRFYRGVDGRALLSETTRACLPIIDNETLVKNYALRYVLFGDLDFDNPGNILFIRSSALTQKTLLHIDGEYIFPDPQTIGHFVVNETWDPSQPVPGSLKWRQAKSAEMGVDEFFEMMIAQQNPVLGLLRMRNTLSQLKEMVLPFYVIQNCLEALPYYEQLARSFEAIPLETLVNGEADFQQILQIWEQHNIQELKPITLKHLVTGVYENK